MYLLKQVEAIAKKMLGLRAELGAGGDVLEINQQELIDVCRWGTGMAGI